LVCSNLVISLFFPLFLLFSLRFSWQLSLWFLSSAFELLVLLWSLSIPLLVKHCVFFSAVHVNLFVSFSFSFLFFSVYGLSPGLTTFGSVFTLLLLLRFWFYCDFYLSPCCWSIARLFLPVKQSVK
jgi:hypothetical protein